MNDRYNAPNSSCCGRPFRYTTEPKCNWSCGSTTECCGCTLGRIKKNADPCKSCAFIPALTVETVDGITNLANCFVHVASINTTFYIDDKHRPMITWAGPVEADVPETITTDEEFMAFVKTFNLHSQYLYARYYSNDTSSYGIMAIYFDKNGKPYWAGEYYEMTEEPLI